MIILKQKLYTCSAIEKLIEQYIDVGGEIIELEEGTLGYGLMLLQAPGYKTAVITEVYLNCWSSAHKIRMYNHCPKKYLAMAEAKGY